jgi:hypothetical protein
MDMFSCLGNALLLINNIKPRPVKFHFRPSNFEEILKQAIGHSS